MGCCLSSSTDQDENHPISREASSAYHRYLETKNPAYLKECIKLYSTLAESRRPHSALGETLMMLADRRWELCVLNGKKTEELEEVIELFEEARHFWGGNAAAKAKGISMGPGRNEGWARLSGAEPHQGEKPTSEQQYAVLLLNLGNAYRDLYDRTPDKLNDGPLQKAIACYQEARNFKEYSPRLYYEATLMLGLALYSRCNSQGHDRRLKDAIRYLTEAYEYFDGRPLAETCVYNLANAYFTLSGKPNETDEVLDRAIEYYQTSIDLLREGNPDRGVSYYNLAQALTRKYNVHYVLSDLKDAAKNAKLAREALKDKSLCPRVDEILAFAEYVLNPRITTVNKSNGRVRLGTDREASTTSQGPNSRQAPRPPSNAKQEKDEEGRVTRSNTLRPWMITQKFEFPPLPDIPIPVLNGRITPTLPRTTRSLKAQDPPRAWTQPQHAVSFSSATGASAAPSEDLVVKGGRIPAPTPTLGRQRSAGLLPLPALSTKESSSTLHSHNLSGDSVNSNSEEVPLLGVFKRGNKNIPGASIHDRKDSLLLPKDPHDVDFPASAMNELSIRPTQSFRTKRSNDNLNRSPRPPRPLPVIIKTEEENVGQNPSPQSSPTLPLDLIPRTSIKPKPGLPRTPSPAGVRGPRTPFPSPDTLAIQRQRSHAKLRNTVQTIINDVNLVEEEFIYSPEGGVAKLPKLKIVESTPTESDGGQADSSDGGKRGGLLI
ncbi:hypothetical protein D9613_011597 [Agrocybe pediades]|uniref:Uncharacterized protein n=1 Tax=Agrocybe pediades TaxID=84607 RepID=A0A8H4VPJ2_9AGAR|nr:hypothetical protein D9613_011597 [Agrocybe pediades]